MSSDDGLRQRKTANGAAGAAGAKEKLHHFVKTADALAQKHVVPHVQTAVTRGLGAGKAGVDKLTTRVQAHGGEEFHGHGRGAVAVLAFGIGTMFGIGTAMFWNSSEYQDLGYYLMLLAFFHLSEFLLVAAFNKEELSADSFLINHSNAYTLALICSFSEYFIEKYFVGCLKGNWFIMYPGLLVALVGMSTRIVAMIQAKHNFTHEVKDEKRDNHELVTTGLYKFCRHPGYAGWFFYTVGMQVVLANPICVVGFAFQAFMFFKDRIEHEEEKLHEFFEDYAEYKKKTPTLIPGIK